MGEWVGEWVRGRVGEWVKEGGGMEDGGMGNGLS